MLLNKISSRVLRSQRQFQKDDTEQIAVAEKSRKYKNALQKQSIHIFLVYKSLGVLQVEKNDLKKLSALWTKRKRK